MLVVRRESLSENRVADPRPFTSHALSCDFEDLRNLIFSKKPAELDSRIFATILSFSVFRATSEFPKTAFLLSTFQKLVF